MSRCAAHLRWDDGPRASTRDNGSGLLVVLLFLPVLTAVAGMLVLSATAETLTAMRYQQSMVVRHAARAGVECVTADLRRQANWSAALSGVVTSSFSGSNTTWAPDGATYVDLVVRGAALQMLTNTDVNRGADTPRWRLYAWGPLAGLVTPLELPSSPVFVGAWVADDGDDGDGDPTVDSNGLVMVHVEAFGRAGARWGLTAQLGRGPRGPDDLWRLGLEDTP